MPDTKTRLRRTSRHDSVLRAQAQHTQKIDLNVLIGDALASLLLYSSSGYSTAPKVAEDHPLASTNLFGRDHHVFTIDKVVKSNGDGVLQHTILD